MDEVVIYASRVRLFGITLGAIVFVALGFWLWEEPERFSRFPLYPKAVGAAAVLFFGVCGLYGFYRLFSPRPALVINEMEILDNASALGAGRILWQEVERIYIGELKNQRFLCIIPKNAESVLRHQNPWKQALMRSNIRLLGAPITIPFVVLREGEQEILNLMRRFSQGRCAVE